MERVTAFKHNARACRDLAATLESPEHREQLLDMAWMWECLAQERTEFLWDHPELARACAVAQAPG